MKHIEFNLYNSHIDESLNIGYNIKDKRMTVAFKLSTLVEVIDYNEQDNELIVSDKYNINYIDDKSKIIINDTYIMSAKLLENLYKYLIYINSSNITYVSEYAYVDADILRLYSNEYTFIIKKNKAPTPSTEFIVRNSNSKTNYNDLFAFEVYLQIQDIDVDDEVLLVNLLYFE